MTTVPQSLNDIFGEPIATYTRADALRDGVLHDLTDLAHEAGIRWPVAIGHHAWVDAIAWDGDRYGETENGRAWDVVFMASIAIRSAARTNRQRVEFTVARTTGTHPTAQLVRLAIHLGAGDNGEPVLTITSPADE